MNTSQFADNFKKALLHNQLFKSPTQRHLNPTRLLRHPLHRLHLDVQVTRERLVVLQLGDLDVELVRLFAKPCHDRVVRFSLLTVRSEE